MAVPVAILDPAPSYRQGLARVLAQAGLVPEEPEDLYVWAASGDRRAFLWTVRTSEEWKALRELRALNSRLAIVTLLLECTPEWYMEALRSGADAAVVWEAPPEEIANVLMAALEGNTLLPVEVARRLAMKIPAAPCLAWITDEEIKRLRLLAAGTTVHELSQAVGYSQRSLYRLLRSSNGKVGVSNRTEAILQARWWGLLEGVTPPGALAPRPNAKGPAPDGRNAQRSRAHSLPEVDRRYLTSTGTAAELLR